MNNHIFLDAETVLDMAIAGRRKHKSAAALLDAIEQQSIRASVCASALPGISEQLADAMGEDDAQLYMQALVEAFDVATVDEAVCKQALEVSEGDFAAAILQVCAEVANADYIVTNDAVAYRRSNIKAIDPARYLQL